MRVLEKIRFAVFTDLHHDTIPDGEKRLEEFLATVSRVAPDFIIQLGDLCYPTEENRFLLEKLERTGIPCYHVMGNHDSDRSSQKKVLEFYGIPRSYYSFVKGSFKFLVLDACHIERPQGTEPYGMRNYSGTTDPYPYLPPEQLVWLENELQSWTGDAIVFSHHSLVNSLARRGVSNRGEARAILEKGTANGKVLLCMNGHDHGHHAVEVSGIWYYTLNAMSYIWHGMKELYPYPPEVHNRYPGLKDIILYDVGLHGVVTITGDGGIVIQGMQGQYRNVTPADAGILHNRWNGVSIDPLVSSLHVQGREPHK